MPLSPQHRRPALTPVNPSAIPEPYPNTPRTNLNNPEQIRTNPNIAKPPDQIGTPPESPPNTPKKTKPEHRHRPPSAVAAHPPLSPPTLRHRRPPSTVATHPPPSPPTLRHSRAPLRHSCAGRNPADLSPWCAPHHPGTSSVNPRCHPLRHTPNNPEQIRTNPNTAERPDQIWSTQKPPPTPRKNKTRTLSPPPLPSFPCLSPTSRSPLPSFPHPSHHSRTPPVILAPPPSFLRRQEPSACDASSHHLSGPAARKRPWSAVETSRRVLRVEAAWVPACAGMTEA